MISIAVGDAGLDQFIVLVDADGDDAAGHDIGEVFERGLLDGAVAGGEEDELAFFFKVADGQDGADVFPGCRLSRLCMDLPLPAAPTSGIS